MNPDHISSYTAGRLIPLDKKPSVRPIGIEEVLRHIVGKAITSVLKPEIVESMCWSPRGVEAAIHAPHEQEELHQQEELLEAVLLVDAVSCPRPDPEQNHRGGAKFTGGCTFSTLFQIFKHCMC